jgi:hypothetical protein
MATVDVNNQTSGGPAYLGPTEALATASGKCNGPVQYRLQDPLSQVCQCSWPHVAPGE